jgi:ABC-type oligopeptide transport system ATPase subunit
MNLNAPIIEARDLTKHFGGTRNLFTRTPTVYAVNGVSFSVQKGETFAIVGESGCGACCCVLSIAPKAA